MEDPVDFRSWGGVDTHKDTHRLCILDWRGREVLNEEFPADAAGISGIMDALGDPAGIALIGIEGTHSYGLQLCSALAGAGYAVGEVVRPRREAGRRGKSDPIDAEKAARAAMEGRVHAPKPADGPAERLRMLKVARDSAVKELYRARNELSSLVLTSPNDVRERFGGLGRRALEREVLSSRAHFSGVSRAALLAMRSIASRARLAREQADALEAGMAEILAVHYPALLALPGVGVLTACALAVAAGDDPSRFGSEAAFAMACGVAPIPASSGKTDRHRINRGGNRDANCALHQIAIARLANDPRTAEYVAKKVSRGKSKKDAIRCLKRYIAREVYRALMNPQPPLPSPSWLRSSRKEAGLTQSQVAAELGTTASRISEIERGRCRRPDIERPYEDFLKNLQKAYLQ